MTVPYIFATATSSIPLSQLDSNFATAITLGNTAVYLGNTTTSIGNLTLTNTTISSVAVTFPNSYLSNSSITIGTTSVSLGGTTTSIAGLTLTSPTITGGTSTATQNLANVTGTLAVGNGGTGLTTLTSGYIPYGNGTSAFSSSSNLYFDGTNLGIGTTSPAFKLDVNGQAKLGGATGLTFGIGTAFVVGQAEMYTASTTPIGLGTTGSASFQFYTASTERMRIDSSGNLLVGTTSLAYSNTNNVMFAPSAGRGYFQHISGTVNGSSYTEFVYNAGVIGSITQSGTTAVLYNVTSDQRLKTNIVDAPSGNIDQIKVRSFDWRADGSHQTYGMVAQELLEVAPYAVHQPTNPDEMMAVDYSKLVPMMIKEIQDLKAEVNQLKQKVGI